jgi:hypothetical protein
MRHPLPILLSAASICALASLVPGVAAANGADANAMANQAQLHPWEANQTGWRPYGAAVGEVYPAAPGGFIGPNGYTNGYSGYYVVVPVVPVAPDYTYGYSPAPAYGGYYVVP